MGIGTASNRLPRFGLTVRLRRTLTFRIERLRRREIVFQANEDEERHDAQCSTQGIAHLPTPISQVRDRRRRGLGAILSDPWRNVLEYRRHHSHRALRRAGRGFARQYADPLTVRRESVF
jgi:hypothetical protein